MRGGCRPDLVLDRVPLRRLAILTIDHYLTSQDVEAIEVYRGVETPFRFGSSPCSAVVSWTRVPEPVPDSGPFWKKFMVASGGLMAVTFLLNH